MLIRLMAWGKHFSPPFAIVILSVFLPLCTTSLLAQTKDWPFPAPSSAAGSGSATPRQSAVVNSTPPPLGAPLRQAKWETLTNRDVSLLGNQALAMNPRSWYHGETENFV